MSESVLQDLNEGVLTVTLNEPDMMNSLTPGISSGLMDALTRASEDDAVRSMVLTGTGRAFCAGANVGAVGGSGDGTPSRRTAADRLGGSGRTTMAFARCDVPIIAAVNGAAVGAGFGIATCCDLRFLGESARMGVIFIKRGLASDYGAAYWLPKIVGIGKAYELMYEGDLLDAATCLDIGLANRVVADEALLGEAQTYAARIAGGPPLGYTTLRRMIHKSSDMDITTFAEYEWTNQARLLETEDVTEGFRAFMQKRDPVFKGR